MTTGPHVLLLGGSGEGRRLAAALVEIGVHVTSSLAGRVADPRLPAGTVRTGGFGGPLGLRDWLRTHPVRAVVDATHPFAVRISVSARAACAEAGVPLVVVMRPPWTAAPGDDWRAAASIDAAAAMLPEVGSRALLTTGRQSLEPFVARAHAGLFAVIRTVDPPERPLPAGWVAVVDRGPFCLEGECALLEAHAVDVLVTKNSGGSATAAKLVAARRRGIPVVVVERPPAPVADPPGVTTVAGVDEALSRLGWLLGSAAG